MTFRRLEFLCVLSLLSVCESELVISNQLEFNTTLDTKKKLAATTV